MSKPQQQTTVLPFGRPGVPSDTSLVLVLVVLVLIVLVLISIITLRVFFWRISVFPSQ